MKVSFRSTFVPNYINDLPQRLNTDVQLFAGDTSVSSVVDNIDESASKLSKDLIRNHDWAYPKLYSTEQPANC